jgi:hypothetical protein
VAPYETWAQVHGEPLVRDTYALRDDVDAPSGTLSAENERRLLGACEDAGVELGAYDRSILALLAGWEPEPVQVVIGLIVRAALGGRRRSVGFTFGSTAGAWFRRLRTVFVSDERTLGHQHEPIGTITTDA